MCDGWSRWGPEKEVSPPFRHTPSLDPISSALSYAAMTISLSLGFFVSVFLEWLLRPCKSWRAAVAGWGWIGVLGSTGPWFQGQRGEPQCSWFPTSQLGCLNFSRRAQGSAGLACPALLNTQLPRGLSSLSPLHCCFLFSVSLSLDLLKNSLSAHVSGIWGSHTRFNPPVPVAQSNSFHWNLSFLSGIRKFLSLDLLGGWVLLVQV